MTGRPGRRHKQLPADLRETRNYWKLKEKALAGCVWLTRFGRSYGPVADLLHDDDDDDDDDDDTNMSPIQGRSWTQWQWDTFTYEWFSCPLSVRQSPMLILHVTLNYLAIYSVLKYNLLFSLRIKFHISLLDHWWPHELLNHVNLNTSYVQTFLNLTLEKTWLLRRQRQQALPCSCPCTKVTVSHQTPTNVYIYYWHQFINTVRLRLVSALKGPSLGKSGSCRVIYWTQLTKLNFTSGKSLCWPCCWNVSVVLPEGGCLRAETFRSDTVLTKC